MFETLEARDLLAAGSGPLAVSISLSPASDPAHNGQVFQSQVEVIGQTAPGARVRLVGAGIAPRSTTADAAGDYQFNLWVGQGTTSLHAIATDAMRQQARADLNVTRGNLVIAWNAAALQAIRDNATPPPLAARDLAIVQAAVAGAVNAIVPTHAAYHVALTTDRHASAEAATASAAHQALIHLFPREQALFDAALASTIAGLPHGPATARGQALGVQAADQILAWRSVDGADVTVPYTPGTAPGQWRPTPPAFAPALYPQWPQVIPFALVSGSQFRPPGPPALNSPEFAAALLQVESVGRKQSTTRTADQTQVALFWADGSGTVTPPGHWNQIAEQVALNRHDSLVTDARVFALLDIALADAGIACWDAKYADNFWRPITAIHEANTIGNPQLVPDPTWTSFLPTPPFPSYVSGHSTFSAAAAAVLDAEFGSHVGFSIGADALPGVSRSFRSFDQAAAEAGTSRVYGGIHYSFDNQDGLSLGRAVGTYVVQHVLRVSPRSLHPLLGMKR